MSVPGGFFPRIFGIGIRSPWPVLTVLLALTLLAAAGLPRLSIDGSGQRLELADEARRQATLKATREFGSDIRSLVLVQDAQLWTPERLRALEILHAELNRLPFVERIDDLFTQHSVRSIEGHLVAVPLLPRLPSDAGEAEQRRRDVLDDPIAARHLVSTDGETVTLGLTIRGGVPGTTVNARIEQVIAAQRGGLARITQVAPARVEAATHAGIAQDLAWVLPAAFLLLAGVAQGVCRRTAEAAMPLAVAALALLWTFGLCGWLGLPLGIPAIILPILAVGLGARATMRMLALWHERGDVTAVSASLGTPFVAATLLTAAGFAGSALIDIPAGQDIGIAAAILLLAGNLIAAFLVPLWLARLRPPTQPLRQPAIVRQLAALTVRAFGTLHAHRSLWIVVGLAALALLCLLPALRLTVANDPAAFLAADHPAVRDAEVLRRTVAGEKLFYVTLEARAEGAFREPAALRQLAEIQTFIAKQAVFDRSLSLANLVAQAHREATGGTPDAFRLPTSRTSVAQYLVLLPPAALAPYVSADFRRAVIAVRHHVDAASTLNHHVGELRQAIRFFVGSDVSVDFVGENLLQNAAADGLAERLGRVGGGLLGLCLAVMTLLFTSARGGFVALIPAAFPVLLVVAVMALTQIPLNAVTQLVGAIALAVAVDGAVHLFSRYGMRCRNAPDYASAVRDTVNSEAPPIIASSLLLAGGFAVLGLSSFPALAQLAGLAAVAIVLAGLANLLLAPLILSRIRLVGLDEILAVSAQRDALLRSPLFTGMSGYQMRKAILISELVEIGDGERLIEQGTTGRSMFVIVSGMLDILRRDGGEERHLARLGPGEVIGEIGFVRATQRTAEARAHGPVTALRFDHDRMARDLALFPRLMALLHFNISGVLGKRLADLVESSATDGNLPRRAETPPGPAPLP